MNRLYLSQPFVACYDNNLDAYIPELWAQEGLAILEENMVMANLVHRDFENEIAKFGDVVNTRKPGEFRIRRKTDGTTLVQQDATATNVPVPLDQWFYESFVIRDGEGSKSFQELKDIYLHPAMLSIARGVDRCLLGRIHAYMGGPHEPHRPVGCPRSHDREGLRAGRPRASERQQGPAGRSPAGHGPHGGNRHAQDRTVHRRPDARRRRHGLGDGHAGSHPRLRHLHVPERQLRSLRDRQRSPRADRGARGRRHERAERHHHRDGR